MKLKKVIAIIAVIALMACVFTGCSNKKPTEPTIPDCVEGMEHDWNVQVFRKVTCEENGLEKRVCKNCEYVEHASVDALGHKFETQEDGVLSICANCGLIENPIFEDTTEDLIPVE